MTKTEDQWREVFEPLTADQASRPFCIRRSNTSPSSSTARQRPAAKAHLEAHGKIRHVKQAAVVENKRLGPLMEMIHQGQAVQESEKRSRSAPTRSARVRERGSRLDIKLKKPRSSATRRCRRRSPTQI